MKTESKNNDIGRAILPLCQIRGIADLFSTILPGETRELTSDACDGIYLTLKQASDEIQEIINQEKSRQKEEKRTREQKLYQIRCGEVAR